MLCFSPSHLQPETSFLAAAFACYSFQRKAARMILVLHRFLPVADAKITASVALTLEAKRLPDRLSIFCAPAPAFASPAATDIANKAIDMAFASGALNPFANQFQRLSLSLTSIRHSREFRRAIYGGRTVFPAS